MREFTKDEYAYRVGQKVKFIGPGKWIKNPLPKSIKRPMRGGVYTIREIRDDPFSPGMIGLLLEEIKNPPTIGGYEIAWWQPEFIPLEWQ